MKKLISVFLIIILIATMMTTVGCVQNDAPVVTTPLLRMPHMLWGITPKQILHRKHIILY